MADDPYVRDAGGLCADEAYPYTGVQAAACGATLLFSSLLLTASAATGGDRVLNVTAETDIEFEESRDAEEEAARAHASGAGQPRDSFRPLRL